MQKPMKIMLLSVGLLFGGIFLYKIIVSALIKHAMSSQNQSITVSAMTIKPSLWQQKLTATGSLRAIRGVNVTTELPGMVQHIYFKPGSRVAEHEVLLQLNADNDIALLHALEANAELAGITLKRDRAQYAIQAVSRQTLDNDVASLKNLKAQVEQQAAIVAKKTIRAPFAGKLGINYVNPGQYLNPGDSIVSLQALDPIYVDFNIPQQVMAQLKPGQTVLVTSHALSKKSHTGKISTINPAVDVATRNVQVEATLANPNEELIPGMFVNVDVITDKPVSFLTLPQTAVTFNPYGSIVFIVRESKQANSPSILTVMQRFVTTGERRGDQIQILKGLHDGDRIVTSGQLKLKNNSQVVIDNTLAPSDNPNPSLKNNH